MLAEMRWMGEKVDLHHGKTLANLAIIKASCCSRAWLFGKMATNLHAYEVNTTTSCWTESNAGQDADVQITCQFVS